MSSHIVAVQNMEIPAGQTDSNVLFAVADYRDSLSLTIWGPASLAETVTIYVASRGKPESPPDSTDFAPLVIANLDATVAAGKAIVIDLPAFTAVKLKANSAVAGKRTFPVNKLVFV